jgi:hypothetical protein
LEANTLPDEEDVTNT